VTDNIDIRNVSTDGRLIIIMIFPFTTLTIVIAGYYSALLLNSLMFLYTAILSSTPLSLIFLFPSLIICYRPAVQAQKNRSLVSLGLSGSLFLYNTPWSN
jgi:hypothetical protein